MDFTLPPELDALRLKTRQFVQDHILPIEHDRSNWDAHDNIAFQVGWQVLMKGNFARYAPGAPTNQDNVNYWFVQTEVRF